MLLSMMRAKLHGATVTECDLHYEGSCAIDEALLEATDLLVGEEVHIWNVSSGARIITYIIRAESGSGKIAVNGAAARHFAKGDKVIITSFAQMSREEAGKHKPVVAIMAEDNSIEKIIR
ncbi:aspartate 1-decarboxylase [Hyphococcus sp.]|uniref:aspartate 1-decarboxylase n=1 Tax=Hyphococcus sp. TaxID=2038636 RepID=UPI003CCC0C53